MEAMRPYLTPHPIIGEFLRIVSRASPLGLPGRPLQRLLVLAAIDVLPPALRQDLNLPDRPHAGARGLALRAFAIPAEMAPHRIVREARARVRRTP